MKYCATCGTKLNEDWKVCPNCGNKLVKKAAEKPAREKQEKAPEPRELPEKAGKKSSKKKWIAIFIVLLILLAGLALILGGVGVYFFLGNREVDESPTDVTGGAPVKLMETPEESGITDTTTSTIKKATTTRQETIEATSTTPKQVTTSSLKQVTTSSTKETTTTTEATDGETLVESCANKYGVESDTVIYVYTDQCCRFAVTPEIRKVEYNKGYEFEFVTAESLDEHEEELLKCYLPPGDIIVPQLICPADGSRKTLTRYGTLDQILRFCEECRETARE